MANEGEPGRETTLATADFDGDALAVAGHSGMEDPAEAARGLARLATLLTDAEGALAAVKHGQALSCRSYFYRGAEVPWEHSWALSEVDGGAGGQLSVGPLFPEELRRRYQVGGVLSAPVLARNRSCIGFVQVFRSGDEFSAEDPTKLEALAELAAPAFQRAVLQQRVLEAESSLEALSSRLGEAAVQQHVLNRLLTLQGRLGPESKARMTGAEQELLDYLRRSREQLATVLQGIAEGIIVHDPGGRVLHANSAAARIFGFASQEDLLQTTLGEVLHTAQLVNEEGAPAVEDLMRVIETRDARQGAELVVRVRAAGDGEERSLIVRSTPLLDEDNRLRFTVSIFTDITERIRAEQLREQFLSMVTHELRSPLAAIKVGVALLRDTPDDPGELQHVLSEIDSQADRLLTLISSLLDMAQVEAGTFSVKPAASSLSEAVEEAFARLPKPVADRVETRLRERLPPMQLDLQRIAQVMVNLLTNADKYSFPGTPIVLTIEQDASGGTVSVANRGAGIPPEQIPALFQRFSRIGRDGPGAGLGLAISKHIVEAHGGRIWVDSSTEQQLTTFSFWLPASSNGTGS